MFFFFFQAEDGIRDPLVTGVQTCALPILRSPERAASPEAGSVRTTTAAVAAASRFEAPEIDTCARSPSSAAFARARSASRDPMTISWPDCAQRSASPAPSLPVPPTIPMSMASFLAEEIARGVAQEAATPALATGPVEPADDGDGNAVQLAHDRLGRPGQLVGESQDGGLQHVAG